MKIRKDGYALLYCPKHPNARGGYVLYHRVVMEKKLGRYLTSEEVVHHKDRDPGNNDPENLELLANHSEHRKLHWAEIPPEERIGPNTGHKHSEATKREMSLAHRGNQSRKGIPHTAEVRARIAATLTGRKRGPHSEATRAKIAKANKGRALRPGGWKHSEEAKRRMSENAFARAAKKREQAMQTKIHAGELLERTLE